jgi:hypothetical protein
MNKNRWLRITMVLLVAGLLMTVLGGALDRTLVEMPAWHRLGAEAWATFSRLADLGNGGYVYSVQGIGGTLLMLGAAVAFAMNPKRPLIAAVPIYGTVLMFICVLLVTTQAAPAMLSLRRIGNDPVALQRAFDVFYKWDSIRAVFVALGGCAKVWALVAVLYIYLRESSTKPAEAKPNMVRS